MDVDSDGSTSEDDQQEQEEDTVLNYDGGLSGGLWHGRGTATYASGTTFRGRFCRGLREGRGVTEFHGVAEFPDGSKQSGRYVADKLEGSGRYDFPSGESLAFCYVSGTMHGPWEERGADGSIRARGEMEDGRRVGLMEVTYADGGQLRGSVDEEGNLGGDDCVYTYPDRVSRLHGRWEPAAAAGSEEEEDEDEDSTGASGGGTEHRLCSARFETDLSIEQEQVQVRASGRGQLSATELRQLQPRETFEYDTCRPGSAHRPSARPLLRCGQHTPFSVAIHVRNTIAYQDRLGTNSYGTVQLRGFSLLLLDHHHIENRDPYEAWRVEVRPSPIGGADMCPFCPEPVLENRSFFPIETPARCFCSCRAHGGGALRSARSGQR
jgi:hypothetical protein